jgi:hypothetical protein
MTQMNGYPVPELSLPYNEGIMHGPYPDNGSPYSQFDGHFQAIEEALLLGRVSRRAGRLAFEGLQPTLADAASEEMTKQFTEAGPNAANGKSLTEDRWAKLQQWLDTLAQ